MARDGKLLTVAIMLAVLRLASGCCGAGCGRVAFFEIYLDGGRSGLDGGELTLCRNGACNAGKVGPWTQPYTGWEQASFVLTGQLSTTATTAYVLVKPDGRATIDAGVPMQQSGDRFDIRFVDAQGMTRLDFSRSLRYDTGGACVKDCPVGSIRVWPTSPNGLTCSARTCDSGAAVTATVTLPSASTDGLTFELCRNSQCGSISLPDFASAGYPSPGVRDQSQQGTRREFYVYTYDDPAVLADGDRYQLTITGPNGSILASVDKTVVYQQSYPNGTECDPYPCRWAEITP